MASTGIDLGADEIKGENEEMEENPQFGWSEDQCQVVEHHQIRM